MPRLTDSPRFQPGFFSRSPYRGVLSEIAQELGVGRSTVYESIYYRPKPRIIELVLQKVAAIDAVLGRSASVLNSTSGDTQ